MIMRVPDWPERLAAAIESRRELPFAWGSHDCALFAADVLREITGCDYMAELRGCYHDALSAMRLLSERGGLIAMVEAQLGKACFPIFAQRGDLVLFDQPVVAHTLGICLGPVFAGPGPDQLQFLPMQQARLAWRVS